MPKFSDMTSDGRPIVNGLADMTPAMGYEFGLIAGYLVFLAGGSVKLPKKAEIRALLEDHFVLDNIRNDDGTATLTLMPIGGGSSLAN